MKITLIQANKAGEDVTMAEIDVTQHKEMMKEQFRGFPDTIIHETGVYTVSDWDGDSAEYILTSAANATANSFVPVIPVRPPEPLTNPSSNV
jgi:hypothetical protein